MIESYLATIPVKEIDYGTRGREDYKDIVGLATSIKERGLIHPIAVCNHPNGTGYLLLAGGRRLRAHEFAGLETIDCKVFKDPSELEIRLIELTENLQRERLEYHEEVKMEREICRLMEQIYGKKLSTSPEATGVSHSDIAKMMGISHAKLSQDLKLVDTMDIFKEIDWTKCKNQSEATKLVDSIKHTVIRQEAVKNFHEVTKGKKEDKITQLASTYIIGDFFEQVKCLPEKVFHMIEIDPPYSIDLQNKKAKKGFGEYSYSEIGYNEVDAMDYPTFMQNTFRECFRVMAPNGFLICWFSPDPWFQPMVEWIKAAGFALRALPCVWIKGTVDDEGLTEKTIGQTLSPMRHLGSACEYFFYATKGEPRINKMGRNNVFSYKPVPSARKVHPTERPLALISEVLETFSIEGSRILVPFAGSGKTLKAAFDTNRIAIGFDLGKLHKDGFIEMIQREEIL